MSDDDKAVIESLESKLQAALEREVVHLRYIEHSGRELRTPLNAISVLSSLLAERVRGEPVKLIDEIARATAELRAIADSLSQSGLLHANRARPACIVFDLRGSLQRVAETLIDTGAQLSIEYSLSPSVPDRLRGDEAQIRQILCSVLGTINKFAQRNLVRILVGYSPVAGAGFELRFALNLGELDIAEEDLRVMSGEEEHADGRGTVGMLLATSLLAQLGGRMALEMRDDAGAQLNVSVPIAVPRPDAEGPVPDRDLIVGRHVLVVDDSRTDLELLGFYLASFGATAELADSPAYALDRIRQGEHFDIALLDYTMPEMTGLELAQQIRTAQRRPDFPIMFITGTPVDVSSYLDQTVALEDILPKPVSPPVLLRALLEKLQATPGSTAPTEVLGAGGRVLLIDADALNRRAVELLIRSLGFYVDVADSGPQALDLLRAGAYGAVVIDVDNGGADSFSCASDIRRLGADIRQPRIVALSSELAPAYREAALEAGMDACLSKPISRTELEGVIGEVHRGG